MKLTTPDYSDSSLEPLMQVAQYLLAAGAAVFVVLAFFFGVRYLCSLAGLGDPETRRSREHRLLRLTGAATVAAAMFTVTFLLMMFLPEWW